MDEYNHDTSFDTLTSDHLFMTQTEDQFPLSNSKQQNNPYLLSKPSDVGVDDSLIEKELKKINQNLNTFTVEHFNELRQQIQNVGFNNAAQKAKRDFNLITAESTNTLMSIKEEDNEIS